MQQLVLEFQAEVQQLGLELQAQVQQLVLEEVEVEALVMVDHTYHQHLPPHTHPHIAQGYLHGSIAQWKNQLLASTLQQLYRQQHELSSYHSTITRPFPP
jgi:hypothetical protein